VSVGWRPAEKSRDRRLLQAFTCAAKGAPAHQLDVQRYIRGRAQTAVNSASKDADEHLLLLFDGADLAGVVVHGFRPSLPGLAQVTARVVEYVGVSIEFHGSALSNGVRASTQLLGLTFAHIASRPVQPALVAAAIHKLNLPSARLFARFGVDNVEPLAEPYRLHWAAWDAGAWQGRLTAPLA
jgi:hypothetical protein